MITHILKELIEQVTIRTVQFDSIETGGKRIFSPSSVVFDNRGNFIELEGARRHKRFLRANQAHVAVRRYCARRNGTCAVKIQRIRHATDMPQLQNDSSSRDVDSIGHPFPARDLFFRPDPWGIRIPDARRRDRSRFGNNQTGAGALLVVFSHQFIGNASIARSASGQWSHDYAIGKVPITDLNRVLQCHHNVGSRINRSPSSIFFELSEQPAASQPMVRSLSNYLNMVCSFIPYEGLLSSFARPDRLSDRDAGSFRSMPDRHHSRA